MVLVVYTSLGNMASVQRTNIRLFGLFIINWTQIWAERTQKCGLFSLIYFFHPQSRR